jgi:hypothetical protein
MAISCSIRCGQFWGPEPADTSSGNRLTPRERDVMEHVVADLNKRNEPSISLCGEKHCG